MIVFFEDTSTYYISKSKILKSIDRDLNRVVLNQLEEGKWYRLVIPMNKMSYLAKFIKRDKPVVGAEFYFNTEDDDEIIINPKNSTLYTIYEISYGKENNLIYENLRIKIKNDGNRKRFEFVIHSNGVIGAYRR